MRYLAEGNIELIEEIGERLAGQRLSSQIARLYSHITRIKSGTSGIRAWGERDFAKQLDNAEKLLVAGMALSPDSDKGQIYLRRAGEIFEWLITAATQEETFPITVFSAAAYQLAGYPARALGVLNEHPVQGSTSQVLVAILKADFNKAQSLLQEFWQNNHQQEIDNTRLEAKVIDQILRAFGIFMAWMRWGSEYRLEIAFSIIEKAVKVSRYDVDRTSWLLAVIFEEILHKYKADALWTVLSPFKEDLSPEGHQALDRYSRIAFLEKKLLAWPSQRIGIEGIISEGSFALCTPTGSGKTRVAELVILKHLFKQQTTNNTGLPTLILYLTPSRALSAEVEFNLSTVFQKIGANSTVKVTSLYGGSDLGSSDITDFDEQPTVIISTHEKADALLRLFGSDLLAQLSCVVIDEAHTAAFSGNYDTLIQAQNRSLRLENLISRLKSLCTPDTTFVALSAVAAEIKDRLSVWMSGDDESQAISPAYRSTRQLFGRLLCSNNGSTEILYDLLDGHRLEVADQDTAPYIPNPFTRHPTVAIAFDSTAGFEKKMRAHLLWAAMHFAQQSDGKYHSVLISVTANPGNYAKTFLTLLTEDWENENCPDFYSRPVNGEKAELLSNCLASCADYFGTDSREYRLLEKGIILHHGKMPFVLANLLVRLVEARVVNIVVATSTLSEGINLPFETVLIPSLKRHPEWLSSREISNIAGRAGRPGVSTEGKTLVLLAEQPQTWDQRLAGQVYSRLIDELTLTTMQNIEEIASPLYALLKKIKHLWESISGSTNAGEFVEWLETTAYSITNDNSQELLTALDTLDQQILSGIEEYESLQESVNLEDFLQTLWRNTLALHETSESISKRAFIRRGLALVRVIYPERAYRQALYNTGLPPRDGTVLLNELENLKAILYEAKDYLTWNITDKIAYFIRLTEVIRHVESFRVDNLNIGGGHTISWQEIFSWWMSPDTATRQPSESSISRWYNFASKYFIYRLNWALGSITSSILESDGGEGEIMDRWQLSGLPWSVLWFKDMVSWGTLDPLVSYVMSERKALTRLEAAGIAADYWTSIDARSDSVLDPRNVANWMERRENTTNTPINQFLFPRRRIRVELLEDFSGYEGPDLNVFPCIEENQINWYESAGYMIARSEKPDGWGEFSIKEIDFTLVPSTSIIFSKSYI